ncbi:MAG: ATP-grasp domain-containing protein, partial [Thiotrichaceae bacterium]|nr:ATP-grasp domain-containing protein [Thiotrichaceae bacterium]
TSPDAIDLAEDRERFQQLIQDLNLKQPPNASARTEAQAVELAQDIGFPLVVRPSYVLGGRAMEIVHNEEDLTRYMTEAVQVSNDSPVLLDRFLNDAIELDVDAVCDGNEVVIGGIMEHIEQAGIHSGDSACSLPTYSLDPAVVDRVREQTKQLALGLKVKGLMNIQFAVKGDDIYVIEVNPRASRTVPFVSKACGISLAQIGARCMAGTSLADQGVTKEIIPNYYSVKEAVFPFSKFPGVDTLLGPEMKSTGEVMGVGRTFAEAFAKAQLGAGVVLPRSGRVFISVRDGDKAKAVEVAKMLSEMAFELVATGGTRDAIEQAGISCERVNKVAQGRPHIVDMIKNNEINFIINTTAGKRAISDSSQIRRAALQQKITYTTTIAGAHVTALALQQIDQDGVNSLQELHKELNA